MKWRFSLGLTFPEEAGLAIGGPESPSHVVIEIHYNNPHRIAGRVDSSGIRFYVTDRLHPYDAGLMELGLTYSARSAIPPRQHEFELRGYCDSQCTQLSFPPEGIVVFASQLHTHQTGIKVATYHMRGNRRLKDLHRDDHYSPHFQEIRLTDELIHVKPGDALITKCTHDTTDVDHVVFGGLSKLNEMCLNYIFYYPKTDLELCKSEVSQPELDDFLNRLAKKQAIKPEASTLEKKFEDIEWNSGAVAELTKFYEQTTVELHCNGSDGARIEGSPVHVKPIRVPYEERIDKIWDKLKCLISNL